MTETERLRLEAMKRYFEQKRVRRPQDSPNTWQQAIDDIDRALTTHGDDDN